MRMTTKRFLPLTLSALLVVGAMAQPAQAGTNSRHCGTAYVIGETSRSMVISKPMVQSARTGAWLSGECTGKVGARARYATVGGTVWSAWKYASYGAWAIVEIKAGTIVEGNHSHQPPGGSTTVFSSTP